MYSSLNFERLDLDSDGQSDDLRISYNGGTIRIFGQFGGSTENVEIIDFVEGSASNAAIGSSFFSRYDLASDGYRLSGDANSPYDGVDDPFFGNRDLLVGSDSSGQLNGGAGNDLLFGGSGSETLTGGAGSDYLSGGGGADRFRYAASSDGNDWIKDFDDSDTIEVLLAGFAGLANDDFNGTILHADRFVTATSASNAALGTLTSTESQFVFHDGSGSGDRSLLYYDANGGDASGRVLLAQLENGATIDASDIRMGF
jgi:Ca2+-binding RTX toxin-like protein